MAISRIVAAGNQDHALALGRSHHLMTVDAKVEPALLLESASNPAVIPQGVNGEPARSVVRH